MLIFVKKIVPTGTRLMRQIYHASCGVDPRQGKRLLLRLSGVDFFGSGRFTNATVGNCSLPKL